MPDTVLADITFIESNFFASCILLYSYFEGEEYIFS